MTMRSLETCRERVWASGDTEACGKTVVREGRCEDHHKAHIHWLTEKIAKLHIELHAKQDELTRLLGSP